jgi:hypothetical protein
MAAGLYCHIDYECRHAFKNFEGVLSKHNIEKNTVFQKNGVELYGLLTASDYLNYKTEKNCENQQRIFTNYLLNFTDLIKISKLGPVVDCKCRLMNMVHLYIGHNTNSKNEKRRILI